MRISDLIRDIKNNSTNFINEKGWLNKKFSWQDGYGAFSYSESNYGKVIDYIKKPETAPCQKNIPAGIFIIPEKIQYTF